MHVFDVPHSTKEDHSERSGLPTQVEVSSCTLACHHSVETAVQQHRMLTSQNNLNGIKTTGGKLPLTRTEEGNC